MFTIGGIICQTMTQLVEFQGDVPARYPCSVRLRCLSPSLSASFHVFFYALYVYICKCVFVCARMPANMHIMCTHVTLVITNNEKSPKGFMCFQIVVFKTAFSTFS